MRVDEFDYHLPQELIAQYPAEPRDSSRLLVIHRASGELEHRHFSDLPEYLRAGDCLALNDTKVVPARLLGVKLPTGARTEVMLVRPVAEGRWEALIKRNDRVKQGAIIEFGGGLLRARVLSETLTHHLRLVQLEHEGPLAEALEAVGHIPLPPYIKREEDDPRDRERYQTVFARQPGAVAAPTASLHFTPELLESLRRQGIGEAHTTLHVSLGTFQPVQVDEVEQHQVHPEWYTVSPEAAEKLNAARAAGGRLIGVGTTVARTLETVSSSGRIEPGSGDTTLFCYPGFDFKVLDALVTNFHLPRSSLLMLVAAFAGLDLMRHAYAVAVEEGYRFYSYGDAMLII